MTPYVDFSKGKKIFPLTSLSESQDAAAATDPVLQRYMREISGYKVLSREESDALAIRAQENNDPEAAYALALANLRLVVKIAYDYQKYWRNNFIDLIQEGNIGLVKAIRKFDPRRGIKFSYYASYWIRAYILRFIQDNWRMIKICTTQTMRHLFFSLHKEQRVLEARGITADSRTLARRLKVKESQVIDAANRMQRSDIALESPVNENSDSSFQDILLHSEHSTEELVAAKDLREKVRALLAEEDKNLDDRERIILQDRLMADSPRTLEAIAGQLELSRERVRQIEVNLLKKLKMCFTRQLSDCVCV